VLPRVPWYWARPPVREGSSCAMRLAASEPTSLLGRALVSPRVLRLQTPPPWSEGLQSRHASLGSRSRIPTQEGSGAAMCHVAVGWG
jgi:hypothetical protein